MIFDTHAHIFPEKISQVAISGISGFYDNVSCHGDGTVKSLVLEGKDAGIDKFLVHSVATVPHQVESINNFISASIKEYPESLVGFMTLHPDYEKIEDEIHRGEVLGLQGIKLHPDQQKFAIDDKKLYPLYELAQGRLPILFHMGDKRYSFSNPHRLAKVMKDFPKLQVIGAHFGGWDEWDEAIEFLKDMPNLWVDSSSTSYWVTKERFLELIHIFGTERVFFASDYPMWSPAKSLAYMRSLGLSQKELDNILWNNAANLLNL